MNYTNDPLVVFACDFEENAFYDDKSVAVGHKSLTTGTGLRHAACGLHSYLIKAMPLRPPYIMSVGTAAAVSENLHVGDVVVGGACRDGRYYQPDGRLLHVVSYGLNEKEGFEVFGGNCMSVDFFISNESDRVGALCMFYEKYFKSAYPHLDETSDGIYICGDMEAAAIADAAEGYIVPFVAVKGISDTGGNNAEETYERNKWRAAHNAAVVAKGILERWTA